MGRDVVRRKKRTREAREPPERSGAMGAPRATVLGSRRGEAPRINERWRETSCEERSERGKRESHRSGAGRWGPRERRCWGVGGAKPLGLMSDGERRRAKKEANEGSERATGAERGDGAPRATVLGSRRGEAPRINERWGETSCEERSERGKRESHRSGGGRGGPRERRCWGVGGGGGPRERRGGVGVGAKPLGLMSDGERRRAKKEANEGSERATGAEGGEGGPASDGVGESGGGGARGSDGVGWA